MEILTQGSTLAVSLAAFEAVIYVD
jgi:hypothetical protein